MLQIPLNIHLDKTAKFDNFYQGSNEQVFQKLQQIKSPSEQFVFVWGNQGVGKSHLAQAVCHEFSSQNKMAVYFPLKNLELRPEALEGLEQADLVCLDNVDFVVKEKSWAEAIFNLFNNLKIYRKPFLVFSQLSPQNLQCELADLRSRFMSMEIYRIRDIDEERKVDFIKQIGQFRGLDITTEVALFLILRCQRGVNSLVATIDKLDEESLAHKRKITIPFVKRILGF